MRTELPIEQQGPESETIRLRQELTELEVRQEQLRKELAEVATGIAVRQRQIAEYASS